MNRSRTVRIPMPTIFTRIISGELPGRFVYRDDVCVAFLTIEPLSPGHTLVVPIEEVESWIALEPELASHLFAVAQRIGKAIDSAYQPQKIGLMIAGLEVPHVHIHVTPINDVHGLDFAGADRDPDPAVLDDAARRITAALSG